MKLQIFWAVQLTVVYVCTNLLSMIFHNSICVNSLQALDIMLMTTDKRNIYDKNVKIISKMWMKYGKPAQHSDVFKEINICLNFSKVVSKFPHFWTSTGFCPPDPHQDVCSWLTSQDMIQNLAYLGAVPNGGISNVRVHFLLDAVSVFRFEKMVYNFTCLDIFIQHLYENGLHPEFEVMGNPAGLFTDFENKTQIMMWRDLVYQLANRYIDKYGLKYVSRWNFESWNEPKPKMFDDLSFTHQGFRNYYDATSEGLMLASKQLKLGAPSGGCKNVYNPANYCWMLLDHLNNGTNYFTGRRDVRADFISIHEKGEPPHNSRVILEKEIQFHELLKKHQPNLINRPIFNDEADPLVTWSKPLSWRADTTYSSMITKVIHLHQKMFIANSSSQLNFHLLSNDNGFLSYQPFPFSQRTLLARFQVNSTTQPYVQFIRKPGYSIMGLLSLLGNKQIYVTSDHPYFVNDVVNVLASVSSPEQNSWQMAVLLYYSTDTEGSNVKIRSHYPQTLKVKLNLHDLPTWKNTSTGITYVIYALDNKYGNPYSIWKCRGSPATPSFELFKQMRANQEPVRISGPLNIPHNRVISISQDLAHSGVLLIHGCSMSSQPPSQVAEVKLYNITFNQVLIVWSDSSVHSKCILRYDVEFSASGAQGTFFRINPKDSVFTVFVYAPAPSQENRHKEVVRGYYRLRAMDYWHRPGHYSPVFFY